MLEYPDADPSENRGEKWRACVMCDKWRKEAELPFDSGSTEPTADETLTGATSGDTGVVESVKVYSGSWAGGDAAGFVRVSSISGDDFDTQTIFQDNEQVNGSVGGNNMFTMNGAGQVKKYGRMYPQSEMVQRDGKWFCKAHYRFRYRHKDMDDVRINIDEGDRGTPL